MKWLYVILLITVSGCIGDDIVFDTVDPEVRITNRISSLEINTSYQFEYTFLNNIGEEVTPTSINWTSSDESIVTIDNMGTALAHSNGIVSIEIMAIYEDQEASTNLIFEVSGEATTLMESERIGSMDPTSSYGLRGNFRLFEDGEDLVLAFSDDYNFDGAPGPYLYLTNNANSIPTDAAYEIGLVTVMSGAHEYRIPLAEVSLNQYSVVYFYCKPFRVRLGFGTFDE